MLSSTLWRAFTTPVTYVLIIVLAVTAIMQVKYLNKALQRFDSTQVIPVQFVIFTISVIIGSAILYRDFESATAESAVKFVGGCLLTFFGVYLITSGRPQYQNEDEDDSESGEEEAAGAATYQANDYGGYDAGITAQRAEASNGVAVDDGENTNKSRRSSHVSFALTPGRPTPQRLHSTASNTPSIVFIPSTSASETALGEAQPPLLNNPWLSSSDALSGAQSHPGIPSTTSSPVLPTQAHQSAYTHLSSLSRTHSQGAVHTPPSLQTSPAPPQADAVRPMTPARQSLSRMMPGPLISPLSSSLSAVVADSLRRGVDQPSRNVRRPRLGVRRSKSTSHRLGSSDGADETLLGSSPLKQTQTLEERDQRSQAREAEWSKRSRARSLSNTLGDFLRGKRQRREEDDPEAGPSGSGDRGL
jgi:hypothetical protein